MLMIMITDWPGSTLRRVHNPLHNADGLAMDVFQVIFSHLIHLKMVVSEVSYWRSSSGARRHSYPPEPWWVRHIPRLWWKVRPIFGFTLSNTISFCTLHYSCYYSWLFLTISSGCRFLYISETVSIYLGLSQVELTGSSLFDYIHQVGFRGTRRREWFSDWEWFCDRKWFQSDFNWTPT